MHSAQLRVQAKKSVGHLLCFCAMCAAGQFLSCERRLEPWTSRPVAHLMQHVDATHSHAHVADPVPLVIETSGTLTLRTVERRAPVAEHARSVPAAAPPGQPEPAGTNEAAPSPPSPSPPIALGPPVFVEPSPLPERDYFRPAPRSDGYRAASSVIFGIGAASLAMGTVAATSGTTPADRAFAVGALGMAGFSFATVGVLYAIDPKPEKGLGVLVAPGALGVSGRF